MDENKKKYVFTDRRGRNKPTPQDSGEKPADTSGKIDFVVLIMSFAQAAMIGMGMMPDPISGELRPDRDTARQNIAIIALLKEKTHGNLSPQEEEMLEKVLYELQMGFVEFDKGTK